MAQTLWKGNIAFGLVTIPVQLYSAIQDKDIHFHLLSPDGKCRLRRKLVCPETGKEYDFQSTARGYEVAPDTYVIVDEEELERLQPEKGRNIEIQQFVRAEEIDPIFFQRPYYIMPAQDGLKAYKLLVQALSESNRVAIARFVMRDHEYLCALRIRDGSIILETLYYSDEIRSAEKLSGEEKDVKIEAKEAKLALQLVESLSEDFKPESFKNEYRERVESMLEKLAKGQKITHPPEKRAAAGKVVNLLDALERSVGGKGRKGRGGKSGGDKGQPKRAA